jgi:hypothetical protein
VQEAEGAGDWLKADEQKSRNAGLEAALNQRSIAIST